MEVYLVAHCYDNVAGAYHFTLTATDIATGWTECVAISNKNLTDFPETGQAAFPTPHPGRRGSRLLHHKN
jgi:hypothetical protein